MPPPRMATFTPFPALGCSFNSSPSAGVAVIKPRACILEKAAAYPPASARRVRKSRRDPNAGSARFKASIRFMNSLSLPGEAQAQLQLPGNVGLIIQLAEGFVAEGRIG